MTKACSKCGTVKAMKDFYSHPGKKDRRQSQCKECTKQAARMRVKHNKFEITYV